MGLSLGLPAPRSAQAEKTSSHSLISNRILSNERCWAVDRESQDKDRGSAQLVPHGLDECPSQCNVSQKLL